MDTQVTPPANEHIFRVRSSTPSTELGSAIAHAVMGGGNVVLRAVGAGAVNQAIKALPIAKEFVEEKGIYLVFDVDRFQGKTAGLPAELGRATEGKLIGMAITVLRR